MSGKRSLLLLLLISILGKYGVKPTTTTSPQPTIPTLPTLPTSPPPSPTVGPTTTTPGSTSPTVVSTNAPAEYPLSWWTGEKLYKLESDVHTNAQSSCISLGGQLLTYVPANIYDNVLDIASLYHPEKQFWSGYTRLGPEEWTSPYFYGLSGAFPWKLGYSSSSPGNCLAMEILPTGIYYYPLDCNAQLSSLCHFVPVKGNSQYFKKKKENIFNSTDYFTSTPNINSKEHCAALCTLDLNCIAFHYNNTGVCHLFDDIMQSSVDDYTEVIPNTDIYTAEQCCYSNGTLIDTCCFSGGAKEPDCNATYSGSVPVGSIVSCHTTSRTIEHPYWSFQLYIKKGCTSISSPKNGTLWAWNTNVNSYVNIYCDTENKFSVYPNYNFTCTPEYKWIDTPRCTILEVNRCPSGWEEFYGSCYKLQGAGATWHDTFPSCNAFNAVPLFIESLAELHFINRMLRFDLNSVYWTGAQKYTGGFEFVQYHDFSSMSWTLNPLVNGLDPGYLVVEKYIFSSWNWTQHQFIFNTTINPTTVLPYICKMGSSYVKEACSTNRWCRGNSICASGKCLCTNYNHIQNGADFVETTKCDKSWKPAGSFFLYDANKQLSWNAALELCANEDAFLFTPIERGMEVVAMDYIYQSGNGKQSWTGLYTEQGVVGIQHKAFLEYGVLNVTRLPWRTMPVMSVNVTSSYVYMEVNALGTRLYSAPIITKKNAICIKYSNAALDGMFVDTDNSAAAPWKVIQYIETPNNCRIHCLMYSECLSYYHDAVNKLCILINVDSSGANGIPNVQMKKISACQPASGPKNGSLMSITGTSLGSTASYQCDNLYMPEVQHSAPMTCNNNGRWSHYPICRPVSKECPVGFEYHNASCYHFSGMKQHKEDGFAWNKDAYIAYCASLGAIPLQIYSTEEMEFVSKILDSNWKQTVWIDGNHVSIYMYFVWTTDPYVEITYKGFYPGAPGVPAQPVDDPKLRCVALSRSFNDTDQTTFSMYVSGCDALKPYLCKINSVLNVGYTGCSVYGQFSCKLHAQCVFDKCVCDEGYFQVGADDLETTECRKILPIAHPVTSSCLGLDGLCINNSICVSNVCSCPPGTYKNGVDGSYSTTCDGTMNPCPQNNMWYYYNSHCFSIVPSDYTNTVCYEYDARDMCGDVRGYLSSIHSEEHNTFLRNLGQGSRELLWIGYNCKSETDCLFYDGTEVTYSNYGFGVINSTVVYSYMDPVGLWRLTSSYSTIITVTSILAGMNAACERYPRCPEVPEIPNMRNMTRPSDKEVNETFVYECDLGFFIAPPSTGEIRCLHSASDAVTDWSPLPTCIGLQSSIFASVSLVYGNLLEDMGATTQDECVGACYANDSCGAVSYSGGCQLISEVSLNANGLPSFAAAIHKQGCGALPYVKNGYILSSTATGAGAMPGDKVTYACDPQFRIAQLTPEQLTCLSNFTWSNPPPVCVSRFKRTTELYIEDMPTTTYYNVHTIEGCERMCIEEAEFRCLRVMYKPGICYLYSNYFTQNLAYCQWYKVIHSELIDSDLDKFDVFHALTYSATPEIYFDYTSSELCAQKCFHTSCRRFHYDNINSTCSVFINNVGSLVPTTTSSYVFVPRTACPAPPVVPGASMQLFLKNPSKYSLGDKVKYTCTNLGEELSGDHNGEIVCQSTGLWSVPPVCRNDCPVGWVSVKKVCYKVHQTPMSFWDALATCRGQDAGLVNLESLVKRNSLPTIWNITSSAIPSVWIGLYGELGVWKWTERQGTDVPVVIPALGAAINQNSVVYNPDTDTFSANIDTALHGFICERASGKLQCPSGWSLHQNNCYKVFGPAGDFDTGRTTCAGFQAVLADVDDRYTKQLYRQLLLNAGMTTGYIGLEKDLNKGFVQDDGSPLTYHKKLFTEGIDPARLCGYVSTAGSYNIDLCTTARAYICKKSVYAYGEASDYSNLPCATSSYCNDTRLHCAGHVDGGTIYKPVCTGTNCHPPWIVHGDSCYLPHLNTLKNFDDAFMDCKQKDSYIVVPNEAEENLYLNFLVKSLEPSIYFNEVQTGILYRASLGRTINVDDGRENTFFDKYNYISSYDRTYYMSVNMEYQGMLYYDSMTMAKSYMCEKPSALPNITEPVYEGCFLWAINNYRTDVAHAYFTDAAMTVEMCVDHCQNKKFKYAALRNGIECRCGQARGQYDFSTGCTTPCGGNAAQMCGAADKLDVYRTSGHVCTEGMVKDPLDESVCYSMVEKPQQFIMAAINCHLMGGQLISIPNPTVEETIANELWQNADNTGVSVWLGLVQPNTISDYIWLDRNTGADWFMIERENRNNFYLLTTGADISGSGYWYEYSKTSALHYACMFRDETSVVYGTNKKRTYTPGQQNLVTAEVNEYKMPVAFDFGCISDRKRCPGGFQLSFWISVSSTAPSTPLIKTGDCMSEIAPADGFCVFYLQPTNSIIFMDIKGNRTRRAKLGLLSFDTSIHVNLVFVDEDNTLLFVDNLLRTTFQYFQPKSDMLNMNVKRAVLSPTDPNIKLANITVIPALPDAKFLENGPGGITSNYMQNLYMEANSDREWLEFRDWGMNFTPWSGPGVDDSGIYLDNFAFNYKLGLMTPDWLNNVNLGYTLAFWINIPSELTGKKELIRFGRSTIDSPGYVIEYDGDLHQLVMNFYLTYDTYSGTIPYFVDATSTWVHLGFVVDTGSVNVFAFGQYLTSLNKVGVGSTINKGGHFIELNVGNGRCPIGYKRFGQSCYRRAITTLEPDFWDHEGSCNVDGGHIVNPESKEEELYMASYFKGLGNIFAGTYSILQGSIYKLWRNSMGYKQKHIFYSTPDPTDYSQVQLGAYNNFLMMTTDPEWNATIHIMSGTPLGMIPEVNETLVNITCEEDGEWFNSSFCMNMTLDVNGTEVNLTTTTTGPTTTAAPVWYPIGCELYLGEPKNRKDKKAYCLSGWFYMNSRCYRVYSSDGLYAPQECSKYRSKVIQVRNHHEQISVANWYYRENSGTLAYMGFKQQFSPLGNISYTYDDGYPLHYEHWMQPLLPTAADMTVTMDCTSDKTCPWVPAPGTAVLDVICEKDPEFECGPGWKKFKGRCVDTVAYTTTIVTTAYCNSHGTKGLILKNQAELDEFLFLFNLGTYICAIDGIMTGTLTSVWQSTNEATFFNGTTIPGEVGTVAGQCVGMDATGLYRQSCNLFTCVACEYDPEVGISLDNIEVRSNAATDAEMMQIYQKDVYLKKTWKWNMDAFSASSQLVHGMLQTENYVLSGNTIITSPRDLAAGGNTTKNIDKILGSYLSIASADTPAIYQLTNSSNDDDCLKNIRYCKQGISVMFWIRGDNLTNAVILSTQENGTTGIKISIDDTGGKLLASVKELNYEWNGWINLVYSAWVHVIVTWQSRVGIKFYVNFNLVRHVSHRLPTPEFLISSVDSDSLLIGLCSNNTSPTLFLDDVNIQNTMLRQHDIDAIRQEKDIKKVLDFNEIPEMSFSNIHVEKNVSLTEVKWRNSLFQHYVHINNPQGLTPAMYGSQAAHCLTRTDACTSWFTTSFWLQPFDMESDQIFVYAGTSLTSTLDALSMKIWYDSFTDQYIVNLEHDKTHFSIFFYIYLYKWSHILLVANLPKSDVRLYVNGQPGIISMTTSFIVDRVPPSSSAGLTFLRIGVQGTFGIDEFSHMSTKSEPMDLYVLKSCHEYEIAGFHGLQEVYIEDNLLDGADMATNVSCLLEDPTYFYLPMDINGTNTNVSVSYLDSAPVELIEDGINGDAALISSQGMLIIPEDNICMGNIVHCFFGLTAAFWVKIKGDTYNGSSDFMLYEVGGDTNQNQTGVTIICDQGEKNLSVLCKVTVLNNTQMWKTEFFIQLNEWTHVALTWNKFRTLTVYKNGHSLATLGVFIEEGTVISNNDNWLNGTGAVCFGCSLSDKIYSLPNSLLIDDVYLMDKDVESDEIQLIYGSHHRCTYPWHYVGLTDKCYYKSLDALPFEAAENTCQSMGGNLAFEENLAVHTELYNYLFEFQPPTFYFMGLKELPRMNFPVRWYDGRTPTHTGTSLVVPPRTYRNCAGMSAAFQWATKICTGIQNYMCEKLPWHLRGDLDQLMYSTISKNDTEMKWSGQCERKRGFAQDSMVFNLSRFTSTVQDRCMVNQDFCHNGHSVSMWLFWPANSTNPKQVVYTTMSSNASHGLSLFLQLVANVYEFGVEFRHRDNHTVFSYPVSVQKWINVAVSVSNSSEVIVYMNGKEVMPTSTSFLNASFVRPLGEETKIIVGSDYDNNNHCDLLFDNLTITEHIILDPIRLHTTVYELFPIFHLSFDDLSLYKNLANVALQDGAFGNGLVFNGASPANYIGYLQHDCFANNEFCLNGLTLSVWIKPGLDLGTDQYIFSSYPIPEGMSLMYSSATAQYVLQTDDDIQRLQVPFSLQSGVWSHLILSWDNHTSYTLLINGVDESVPPTVTLSTIKTKNQRTLSFGGGGFRGGVDELWFWTHSVLPEEQLEIYKNSTFIHSVINWDLEEISNTTTTPSMISGTGGQGVQVDSGISWLPINSSSSLCFSDIDKCVHGFTLSFSLRFDAENDIDQLIFTTGGHNMSGLGISLEYTAMNKSLPFRRYFEINVRTSDMVYVTWFNMQWNIWNMVTITYHKLFGVKVFVDGKLSSLTDSGSARITPPVPMTQKLVLGEVLNDQSQWKGRFSLDQIEIVDRALFEDKYVFTEELWQHWLHTDIPVPSAASVEELTRDECHAQCSDMHCPAYRICGDQTYSSCHIYDASASVSLNGTMTFDPDCDLFAKFNTFRIYQSFGCIEATSLGQLNIIASNATTIEECVDACSYNYTFAAYEASSCYCGLEDVKTSMNVSVETNATYICDDIEVYQIIGLRDFLNVTVPIVDLTVNSSTGYVLYVNQVFNLTMIANDLTYAGFRIDLGDGTDVFYTGRNFTTHAFGATGTYYVEILALNEISWFRQIVEFSVFSLVDDISIQNNNLTATFTDFITTVLVSGGNNVTCEITYTDGYVDSIFHDNTSVPYVFTYQYLEEGIQVQNVTCYNNISSVSNSSLVETIHPVVNLTLNAPPGVVYGEWFNITWEAALGSNVSLFFHDRFDGPNATFFSNNMTLGGNYELVFNTDYKQVGQHVFNVTVSNIVTDDFSDHVVVDIEELITSIDVSTEFLYNPSMENVTFDITCGNGSNFDVYLDFGDNTTFTDFVSGLSELYNRSLPNVYYQEGPLEVSVVCNNSVNQLNTSLSIFLQHSVKNINLTDVSNSMGTANFTFELISNSDPSPTDAFMDIYFGDGSSNIAVPFVLDPLTYVHSHAYAVDGYYNIQVIIYNNVSTISINRTICIGEPITGFTVTAPLSTLTFNTINITLDILTGTDVMYFIDFGDGNITSCGDFSSPNAQITFPSSYSQPGTYVLNVTAINNFYSVNINNVSVHVQEPVTGLSLTGDKISKINYQLTFQLYFIKLGTQSCIVFSPGDGSQYLLGHPICPSLPQYQHLAATFVFANTTLIEVQHTYLTANTYVASVNATNFVSSEASSHGIILLEFPCDFPTINIPGFSQNISAPSKIFPSVTLIIRGLADTICFPVLPVLFDWNIEQISGTGFVPGSVALPSLPYLWIAKNQLQYGIYHVNVTVSIEGFPMFNYTSDVYLEVINTPMVLEILGDSLRSVPFGLNVELNADRSFDPDFPVHYKQHMLTWYCWMSPDTFDPEIHEGSPSLLTIGTTGAGDCHSGVTYNGGSIVELPSTNFNLGESHTFVAAMRLDNRTIWKTHTVNIVDSSTPLLAIKCVENCGEIVSSALPIRLMGECYTCTYDNRLDLGYTWEIYKVEAGASTLVSTPQFGTDLTNTGLNIPSLSIKSDALDPGSFYDIKLIANAGYTVRKMITTSPPYNGQCTVDKNTGVALSTAFVVTCDGYLDESRRTEQDPLVDSVQLASLDFNFWYRYNTSDGTTLSVAFFKTQGTSGLSPEIMLPPGRMEDNYEIQLITVVTDMFGSYTESVLIVQVMPSKLPISQQLTGFEYSLCDAEKDMMCMLVFAKTVTDSINSVENATAVEIDMRKSVIEVLKNNSELIQDSNLALTSVTVLQDIQDDISGLDTESLEQMSDVYGTLVGSFESSLKTTMTASEKEALGKEILTSIIEFSQVTKYDPECSLVDCTEKQIQGNMAIDIISFTSNITNVLLEGAVPDEYGYYLEIPTGDCKLLTQRRETLNLFNSTLVINGQEVADVPDLSSSLNMSSVDQHIDVEILVSDNLFTTDPSTKQTKTRTTSITLYDSTGAKIKVNNLPEPIAVKTFPEQMNNVEFTTVDLTQSSHNDLFLIELRMNETSVFPVLMLKQFNVSGCLMYFLKIGSPPTSSDYSVAGEFCEEDYIEYSNDSALFMRQFDDNSVAQTFNSSNMVTAYLGLYHYNASKDTAVDVAFHVRGCSYWNDRQRRWTIDGLMLDKLAEKKTVTCLTNHLTTFSVNFFVPPNTINFSTVFSKFDPNNTAVLGTVCGIIGLYLLLIFFVYRADKRDVHKWAIYPLKDNVASDVYHYQLTFFTGLRKNAGTKSKVFFVLGGEGSDTEVRELKDTEDRNIDRGSVMNYLLSVPHSLGDLTFLRIWHDNSGKGDDADWYLNMVTVKDIQTNIRYNFVVDDWLALTKGDGQIEKLIPVAGDHELSAFDHAFYQRTRKDITDGHLWISVFSRPTQSVFTRVQRWSCCLSLLFLTMITNAMWYKTRDDSNQQNVHLGPFTFSAQEVTTSIMSSLIVVPVSLLIITLFKNSKRKTPKNAVSGKYTDKNPETSATKTKGFDRSDTSIELRGRSVTPGAIDTALIQTSQMCSDWQDFEQKAARLLKDQSKISQKKKKKCQIPHWGVYIAWLLVALSVGASGFFTILYSFEWGTEKSSKWLTAFILSFVESVLFIQPLKVVVVAIVLILIFKKPTENEDEEGYVNEVNLSGLEGTKSRTKYPDHRKPYTARPPNNYNIEEMRLKRKRMNRLFNIGRELAAYIFYLTIVAVMAYENRDKQAFRTFTHLSNMFVNPATKFQSNLVNVSRPEAFWNWTQDILIPGLYSQGWYNGFNTSDTMDYIGDNIHYRVGTPRIRQARVQAGECKTYSVYRKYFHTCYLDYGFSNYEDADYSEGWSPYAAGNNVSQWTYKTALDLNGYPIVGTYGSYSGGGYVASLGASDDTARNIIDYLKNTGWLDRQTRAVIIEANVFNPNINLFSLISLTLEFPASGSIVPYIEISPVILYRYVGASAIFLLVFDILFLSFTLYYMHDLYKRIKEDRCAFFTEFWNVIDFVNMCLSFCVIAFFVMHFIMVQLATTDFRRNKAAFLNLQHIVMWNNLTGIMLGFLLFLSMNKLLLLCRFNTKITQLSGTLKKLSQPFLSFFVVFGITFMAFAMFGYFVFGSHDIGYNNFINSLETLMSMLMMKMEIEQIMTVNPILASAYLFVFVLFVVFILLNMMLSIINEAFTEVREDPSFLPDDPELVSFFFEEMRRMIFGGNVKGRPMNRDVRTTRTMEEKIGMMDKKLLKFIRALKKDM